ncbi:hypothetical protein Ddye_007712 [Dipteronia dyeriana]|uniref:Uncharacterized protein n=1 Tax=Dipteronia dyeriana TaxID=168575 RepID=A0AAE0CRY0_9ROSI|nr:hypothetical protein Ddye_007712 [Dipteronia dyeriana]
MNVELFNCILSAIESNDDYFTQKVDAVGKLGLSPLQKTMAAVQMLAYGCPADFLDEYVQNWVFETQYLRKPNKNDIARLLKEGEDRGFPGMLGSLDCPTRIWNAKDLGKIMKTCIILHNMIIENEHHEGINPESWEPYTDEMVDQVDIEHDYTFLVSKMINRMKQVRDTGMHNDLKMDLINHLWDNYGGQQT